MIDCDVPPKIVREIIVSKAYGDRLPKTGKDGQIFFIIEGRTYVWKDPHGWNRLLCKDAPK